MLHAAARDTNPKRKFWCCAVDATPSHSLSLRERIHSFAERKTIGRAHGSVPEFRKVIEKPADLKGRPRVFAPKGQPQISPGQRPGTIATHSPEP